MPDLDIIIQDEAIDKKMFIQLKNVDGFMEWIDNCLKKDLLKHYNASSEAERANIKAASERLILLKKQLIDADKPIVNNKSKTISY